MEIVNFYGTCFSEIPEQDNPAFGEDECLMIISDREYRSHAIVLHIKPDTVESVTHIAKFWDVSRAVQYCDTFTP